MNSADTPECTWRDWLVVGVLILIIDLVIAWHLSIAAYNKAVELTTPLIKEAKQYAKPYTTR